jgi:hypothetical protein
MGTEGNGSGSAWILGQLFGGTVAVLAIVGALALCAFVWGFRRLWLFLRLELMIDARKATLNELASRIQTAEAQLEQVKTEVLIFSKRLPPNVPKLVRNAPTGSVDTG